MRNANAYEEARFQGVLWTPAVLRGSLSLWLDSADLSTISIATGVSQWIDKSGIGRNATQANPASQPTLGTFQLNGMPLVSTFGSTTPRFIDTAAWTPPADFDFFWVTTSDGASQANINALYDHDHSAAPNGRWVIQSDNANFGQSPNTITHYASQYTGSWQLVGNGANGIGTGGPVIGLFRRRAAASLVRNGTTIATAAFGNMVRDNRAFRVGGVVSTSGRGWRGGHAEVIYTNRSLSNPEVDAANGYLAWKWGLQESLPATHPFRNRPPLIGD